METNLHLYAFCTCCCTVNYTLLHFYATSFSTRIHLYASMPLRFWYCTVNYMLNCFMLLLLFASIPLHLYTLMTFFHSTFFPALFLLHVSYPSMPLLVETLLLNLKWYYDQKIISFFSSEFESVFA